jgi:hypothetical protein
MIEIKLSSALGTLGHYGPKTAVFARQKTQTEPA